MTTNAHFNDASRKRLGQTTYFPGQRIEGYIELDAARNSSRLDVTLRRVVRYSALETEEHPTAIKSVSSLVSHHGLLDGDPQTSSFVQDGSASRLPFSLILPEDNSIPSVSGHMLVQSHTDPFSGLTVFHSQRVRGYSHRRQGPYSRLDRANLRLSMEQHIAAAPVTSRIHGHPALGG